MNGDGDPVPTGCDPVDDLLGGGFERGTVTQVYGVPAAGKTNLVLGAAVEAAASGGTAVYIDTEGVSLDRFEQLARARVRREETGADRLAGGKANGPADASSTEVGEVTATDAPLGEDVGGSPNGAGNDDAVRALTSRIVMQSAYDFAEQEEAVRDAGEFAERAELIVLDSATGFYRLKRGDESAEEAGDTLRRVTSQVTHLLSLARRHDLAAVITNQVFTDPDSDRTRGLGGHTLEHWTGSVLRIDRFRGGNRRATLEKHRSKPAGESVQFRITDAGLEGVDDTARP